MSRTDDRKFYAENEAPALGRMVGTGCVAVLAFPPVVMLMFWLLRERLEPADILRIAGVVWALPMVFFGPRLMRASGRSGVSVDDYGLTEHYSFSTGRRVAWDEVHDLHVGFDQAWVDTAQGRIDLGPPLTDWSDLAHRVGAKLGLAPHAYVEEDADIDVASGLVAQWLGVGDDRARVCRTGFWPLALLWQAAVVVWAVRFALHHSFTWMFGPCVGFAILAMTWTQLHAGGRRDRRIQRIVATPEALEVDLPTGRRRFAWGSLRQLSRRGLYWVITTSHGDLWLPPLLSGRKALLNAVRHAIEARKEGKVLPRMGGEVPDGAISRVSVETGVDRGLTVVDRD